MTGDTDWAITITFANVFQTLQNGGILCALKYLNFVKTGEPFNKNFHWNSARARRAYVSSRSF